MKDSSIGILTDHSLVNMWVSGKLPYKSWVSCLMTVVSYEFAGSCLRASLMWGELSWGELSLGRDVCNSPQHGLHINSLLGFCPIKPKVQIESTLEKRKF